MNYSRANAVSWCRYSLLMIKSYKELLKIYQNLRVPRVATLPMGRCGFPQSLLAPDHCQFCRVCSSPCQAAESFLCCTSRGSSLGWELPVLQKRSRVILLVVMVLWSYTAEYSSDTEDFLHIQLHLDWQVLWMQNVSAFETGLIHSLWFIWQIDHF